MEGIWGHEQGVNNTFYGSPDGGDSSPNYRPVISAWSKMARYKLPVQTASLPPIVGSCILGEVAGGDVGVSITAPFQAPRAPVSPQRFLYKRNLVLKRMWDPMPLASDTFLGWNFSKLSLSQTMNVLVSVQEVVIV